MTLNKIFFTYFILCLSRVRPHFHHLDYCVEKMFYLLYKKSISYFVFSLFNE
jgi:hypothetical protein